jgi:multidrug resistance efflux pump
MPNEIDVDVVEAELQAAQAEYDAAQREYERLKNGPDPNVLALAEQRVKTAEAQLAAAEAALDNVELAAPITGTVAALSAEAGTWVNPGQPLLMLLDLAHMQVKTTDLSERDVPSVQVGQAAQVYVKALGVTLDGKVQEISPLAEALGGDVVYTTTIDLPGAPPAGLRAGMSVDVSFLAGK